MKIRQPIHKRPLRDVPAREALEKEKPAAEVAPEGVQLRRPSAPIDALQFDAELAARGLVDANKDGLLAPSEITPSANAPNVADLRMLAGSKGALDANDIKQLPSSVKAATKRKVGDDVEKAHELLEGVTAAWPPTTDAALGDAVASLKRAADLLGALDPSELGLASRLSLKMLNTELGRLGDALRDPIPTVGDLQLPTFRRMGELGPSMAALGRIASAVGAAPDVVAQLQPPRLQPRVMSTGAVQTAKALRAEGDIAGAWKALAAEGDKYAASAARIIDADGPNTDLFSQIVQAHWDRVVGPETKAEKFDAVAVNQLSNYLDALESKPSKAGEGFELPNTEVIEQCYRRAVEAEGLPPKLAIDSVISKIDLALSDSTAAGAMGINDLSWGSMLNLDPDRLAFNSQAFADIDLSGMKEFMRTAAHTVAMHPTHLKLGQGMGMMMNTVRALWAGQGARPIERNGPPPAQALSVDAEVVGAAREALDAGDVAGMWAKLHDAGDGYAHYPYLAASEMDAPRSLMAQVVNAHWDRLVGADVFDAKFADVNANLATAYVELLEKHEGRLPNTQEIEQIYRAAVEQEGLPAALVPDAAVSKLADGLENKALSWATLLGVAKERVVFKTGVFADLEADPLKELFADNLHWIAQRHVTMPFGEMARMTWQRVREMFS